MKNKSLELFKALADATRQEILGLLGEEERSVNEICASFERITQPTVSHHLQILKRCEIVDTHRKGKRVFYSVNKKVLRNGFEEFIEKFKIQVLE